ncbi:MAG: peptide ABC transporter substrate-binding protein, partial [Bacillati bacterium ANGP1]
MNRLRGPGTVWMAALAIILVALPAASQQAPRRGGAVTLALYQEPELLNPNLATQTASFEVAILTVEGLLAVNDKGEYYPQLAMEVPTPANGGVSQDGKTITYRLRSGLTWSDGHPLTCDDVKFTWEAIVTPKSGAVTTSGYDQIQAVDCPNAQTAIVRYKDYYAPFLSRFRWILPRHATGDP